MGYAFHERDNPPRINGDEPLVLLPGVVGRDYMSGAVTAAGGLPAYHWDSVAAQGQTGDPGWGDNAGGRG